MADHPWKIPDIDPEETREWLDALASVIEADGPDRAHFLIEAQVEKARRSGAYLPYSANTAYLNTISPQHEASRPGDPALERRIKSIIRWNAMAMVVRANRDFAGIGGHIASYQSAATLYEVGFNHFFRAPHEGHGGDLVFMQGHSAPGVYARAFLEGRLGQEQLEHFRRESRGKGLSSYPHPHLLPDFWQFATVSMGLGPLMAIYQARFMKYLHQRGLIDMKDRKIWAFLGDGEMDEPESLGAISLAVRENLDNLVFVINCNLQRLDGPVRGNSKVIQEFEKVFRGAGWNVIKVIWGSNWDPLLAKDKKQLLRKRMDEAVDGDYQAYAANRGAFIRQHFFGTDPELLEMVADMTDDDLWRLKRGGHDPDKVYAAYAAATAHQGQPTVILAKTIKGYGMGEAGEGLNPTHQQKKMGEKAMREFRDRFAIPISDDEIAEAPFYKPSDDTPLMIYLKERREKLGGSLPARHPQAPPLEVPDLDAFKVITDGSGGRDLSTTMSFVRALTILTRDKKLGPHVVPIIADEARTFGMEGMFRQLAIYTPFGQKYRPVDADQLMYYREEADGQILQEGITEAGSMGSWIAAGTSYANHGIHMVPCFIFYSMFGFQRVGDFIWAAADMKARGFLFGATSGRTTLNGEGLQHQDGHSHLMAAAVPTCRAYDPTYGYELAVILRHGLKRMYQDDEDEFYYLTVHNENYEHPSLPGDAEEGICRGMYQLRKSSKRSQKKRVQLLGSGSILLEVLAAAELLEEDFGVAADVWSVTSFTELRRDGLAAERWNLLHPEETPRRSWVEEALDSHAGPVVASTDWIKSFPDQIRAFVPRRYTVLGTDGFGRSDTRPELRRFFEIDRFYVVLAALKALTDDGAVETGAVKKAIEQYGIDVDKADPSTL